jgi:hypothetical protein
MAPVEPSGGYDRGGDSRARDEEPERSEIAGARER